MTRHKNTSMFWLACLVLAGFAAGLWASSIPSIGGTIRLVVGGLLVFDGVLLVSPFATSRPVDEPQRRARRRISVMGMASMVFGAANMVSDIRVALAFMALTMLLMAAAATGLPKRLFADR